MLVKWTIRAVLKLKFMFIETHQWTVYSSIFPKFHDIPHYTVNSIFVTGFHNSVHVRAFIFVSQCVPVILNLFFYVALMFLLYSHFICSSLVFVICSREWEEEDGTGETTQATTTTTTTLPIWAALHGPRMRSGTLNTPPRVGNTSRCANIDLRYTRPRKHHVKNKNWWWVAWHVTQTVSSCISEQFWDCISCVVASTRVSIYISLI